MFVGLGDLVIALILLTTSNTLESTDGTVIAGETVCSAELPPFGIQGTFGSGFKSRFALMIVLSLPEPCPCVFCQNHSL